MSNQDLSLAMAEVDNIIIGAIEAGGNPQDPAYKPVYEALEKLRKLADRPKPQPQPRFVEDVAAFAAMAGQATPSAPSIASQHGFDRKLRAALVVEEAIEYATASGYGVSSAPTGGVPALLDRGKLPDMGKMVDGAIDTLYVAFGALAAMGFNTAEVKLLWDEVHRSNMEKQHGPVCPDTGKKLKPPGFKPPDFAGLVRRIVAARESQADLPFSC